MDPDLHTAHMNYILSLIKPAQLHVCAYAGHPTAWALGIWDKRALLRRLESEGPCPQRHRSSSTTPARLFRHFSCPSSSAEPSATTDKPLMASLRSRRARVPPTVPASCFQQAPSTPLDAPLTEAGTWPPSVQPHSRRTMPRAPISCFQQAASAAAGPSCKHRSSPQVPASCFQQDTSSLYEADMTSDEDQPSCLEGCRRRYGPCLPVSGFQLEASIPADGWQSSFGPVKAALMPVASTGGYAQGISRPKISRIQDSAAAGLSPPTNLLAKSGAAASFKLPSALSGGAEQGTTAASIGPVTRPAYSMLAEKAKGMVVQPSLARSGSFSFNSAVQLSHGALLPPTAFEAWWFRQGSSGVGDAPGQPGTATASRTKSHDLPCMAGSLDSSSTEEHSGNFDGTVRICVDAGATVLSVPAGQPQPIAHFDGDAYLFRDAYGWSHGASHPDGRQLPGQPHSGPDQFDGDAYLFRDAPSPASHAPVESLEHGCDCLAPAFSFSPADQEDPVGMSPWPPCLGH